MSGVERARAFLSAEGFLHDLLGDGVLRFEANRTTELAGRSYARGEWGAISPNETFGLVTLTAKLETSYGCGGPWGYGYTTAFIESLGRIRHEKGERS